MTVSGWRVQSVFARYVSEVWFPNHRIELTTRQNYSYYLDKHILPAFGGYKMIEIMPADIRDWITTATADGVKPSTIKYCLSVLSAIFTTALNDQITTLHPCKGVKAPTVASKTRQIVTPAKGRLRLLPRRAASSPRPRCLRTARRPASAAVHAAISRRYPYGRPLTTLLHKTRGTLGHR